MCGRYGFTTTDPEAVQQRFDVPTRREQLIENPNIKPTQTAPTIVMRDGKRQIVPMRWGLIPAWAKDPAIGGKTFNARAETVAEKPSFRTAFRKRRCLIPATGFYEWQTEGRQKTPWQFVVDGGELFAFAGLHESWRGPSGEPMETYTLITTTPNELVAPIHNRMPVILQRDVEALWLDPKFDDVAQLESLLQPYPADQMQKLAVDGKL